MGKERWQLEMRSNTCHDDDTIGITETPNQWSCRITTNRYFGFNWICSKFPNRQLDKGVGFCYQSQENFNKISQSKKLQIKQFVDFEKCPPPPPLHDYLRAWPNPAVQSFDNLITISLYPAKQLLLIPLITSRTSNDYGVKSTPKPPPPFPRGDSELLAVMEWKASSQIHLG